MGQAVLKPKMTGDEYLAWEAEQTEKHNFVNGEIYAMAGAERGHVTTAGNVYIALRQHLTGSPCRAYIADMKVQTQEGDQYFYPDVVVRCQPKSAPDGKAISTNAPVLVIEILSDSTATWDRGGKFAAYRQLPSLQEYVLIDPQAQTVELYRRNAAQRFELYAWDARTNPGPCEFASVGLLLPLADVFEGVVPEPAADPAAAP